MPLGAPFGSSLPPAIVALRHDGIRSAQYFLPSGRACGHLGRRTMQREMTTTGFEPPPAPYKDRSGALVAFGVFELLIALGCLFLVVMMLVSTRLHPANMPPGYSPPNLALASVVYLVGAVAFAWLGVGSILARRWACALSLALAWLWLAAGAIGGVFLLVLLPRVFAVLPAMPSSGARAGVMGCLALFWAIFLLFLPLAFVLFYGGSNVRRTCAARDPRPRWTDRCPIPVLVLVLMSAVSIPMLVLSSLHPAFPAFGRTLTGPPAAAAFLAFAALEVAVARGLYRLRPAAWWGRLALSLFSGASTALTFYRGLDWEAAFRASGQPDNPAVRQMMTGVFHDPLFLAAIVLMSVAGLGYMLWIRRYFVPRPA
jgi:hypothetical protein